MKHYNCAVAVLILLGALLCVRSESVGITVELCGDGIDQDSDGADLLCPGDDKDNDGFPSDQDCDDTNRYIYDSISVACSCSGGGTGWKTCKGSSFTTCECNTPLCEATGDGKCYYVDAVNGDDANPGTYDQPWKSYLKFNTYYSENLNAVKLSSGDCVYFMNGSYSDTFKYDQSTFGMFFRTLNPTAPIMLKNYPGHIPIFNAPNTLGIHVLQSSNIVIEGFEVTAPSYGAGIFIAEVTNVTIRNCWVHDIDGVDNNNIAGVHLLTSYNGHVHHNRINDNYDRTNADTGGIKTANSRNMVLFNGGDNKILYNVIYQTKDPLDDVTGGGITYKHRGDDDKTFEVAYNYFWNSGFHAIGSGTANSHVHHNLIFNCMQAFAFSDHGGGTSMFGEVIEYNTIIDSNGLGYIPVDTYGTPIGSFEYKNNIIIANTAEFNRLHPTWETKPIVVIDRYGSNDYYNKTVPYLTFDNNCYAYSEGNEKSWDLYSLGESFGGTYNLSEWQALGFDKNSLAIDAGLDNYFVPTAASCKDKGYASFSSTPNSPTSTTSPSSPSSPKSQTPSNKTSTAAFTVVVSSLYVMALLAL